MPDHWNIHTDVRDLDEPSLAAVMRIVEAAGPDDGVRSDELAWYMRGGFDSINPLLRASDPLAYRFSDHRDEPWLRERVRKAVREIDSLPRITLDEPLTLWRATTRVQALPARGRRLRDRAFLSCSVRRDVVENMLEWQSKTAMGRTKRILHEITVPAGTPLLAAWLIELREDCDRPFGRYIPCNHLAVNEAEVILDRHVYLDVTGVREYAGGRAIVRSTAVQGRRHTPSTEIVPAREELAGAA
jgi:hypothetical protein